MSSLQTDNLWNTDCTDIPWGKIALHPLILPIGSLLKCFSDFFTSYSQALTSLAPNGARLNSTGFSLKKKLRNRPTIFSQNRNFFLTVAGIWNLRGGTKAEFTIVLQISGDGSLWRRAGSGSFEQNSHAECGDGSRHHPPGKFDYRHP